MNDAVLQAINDQIKHEFDAAYAYLQASAYFESHNLAGFARWMRAQSQEEVAHAMKLFDFVLDRGAQVTLQALDQPRADFASSIDAFARAQEHERVVTTQIDALYALAVREKDYPAQVLLQWFINEQVEEESWTKEMVDRAKAATCAGGFADLDRHINRFLGAEGE